MSISTGPITSRSASSASAWSMLSPVARRNLRQILLAVVLPVVVIVFWQWAGNGGSLFGGVLPTPDRVWQAWKVWAFGAGGLGLNPYSGTWLANLLFSAERVGKGFAEEYRFLQAMRDEDDRSVGCLPDAYQFPVHNRTLKRVECAERLIHQQNLGLQG